jgi:hypothetical protein
LSASSTRAPVTVTATRGAESELSASRDAESDVAVASAASPLAAAGTRAITTLACENRTPG